MSDFVGSFVPPPSAKAYDGTTVEFARLDMDDLAKWCDDMHQERKKLQMGMMPPALGPLDKFKVLRSIEFGRPTLDDVADAVYTPKGALKALTLSLTKKGGYDAAKIAATLGQIKPSDIQKVAREVAGLFKEDPPETPKVIDNTIVDNLQNRLARLEKALGPEFLETSGLDTTGSVPPLEPAQTGGGESTDG